MKPPGWPIQVAVHAVLLLATIAALYPVIWVVDIAVSPGNSLPGGIIPIPDHVTGEHFGAVVGHTAQDGTWLFARQLVNSLVVSFCSASVGLVVATTSAYALSRFTFPGRSAGMRAFLVTQTFPAVVMAIPLYELLSALNLLDSKLGLVLVYSATAVPFSTWTLKGYFDTIPREIEEAALLDGASRWYTFTRLVLPLTRPALAVTGLFSFMTAWNEFVLAATLQSDPRSWTLPVQLQSYVSDYGTQWGPFAAASIVVSVPVMLLFFALQRQLVGGLAAGAVKG